MVDTEKLEKAQKLVDIYNKLSFDARKAWFKSIIDAADTQDKLDTIIETINLIKEISKI